MKFLARDEMKNVKEWFDEEYEILVEEKNKAREKLIPQCTRNNKKSIDNVIWKTKLWVYKTIGSAKAREKREGWIDEVEKDLKNLKITNWKTKA